MTRFPVPSDGGVYLDHVGHFVADADAASSALARLGFLLTPYSLHTNREDPGKPPVPAGTANRLAMLAEGYLEFLNRDGPATPLARQLEAAVARYVGVHLMAFAVCDAEGHRERLQAAGFKVGPAVALQRETEDAAGNADIVRFTVIRPVPGEMEEGRVQMLRHDRPDLMWQRRWMDHPNRAVALTEVFFASADPDAAAARYARYLNRPADPVDGGYAVRLARGRVVILSRAGLDAYLPGLAVPDLPFIAGYRLRSADLSATRNWLAGNGFALQPLGDGALAVTAPPALGGTLVFGDSH